MRGRVTTLVSNEGRALQLLGEGESLGGTHVGNTGKLFIPIKERANLSFNRPNANDINVHMSKINMMYKVCTPNRSTQQ